MLQYYVIDVETTGLSAATHEVVDISIIRFSDRANLTRKIRAEHPETASRQALEITGRTFESLLEGDSKEKVVEVCNEFFNQDGLTAEHRCMIGHNSSFDRRFCYALWEKCGKQFPTVCWMDTIKFAKIWAKQVGKSPENFKLESVLKFAEIKYFSGKHNSEDDAKNTYLICKKGMDLGIDHLPAIKRCPHILPGSSSKMEESLEDLFD